MLTQSTQKETARVKIAEQKKKYVQPVNNDEQPVGKSIESAETKVESEAVLVPSYNFEQMLEQALKQQDADEHREPTTRHAVKKDHEEEKELTEAQKKKQQLLEKRKKYDPRAALKAKAQSKPAE